MQHGEASHRMLISRRSALTFNAEVNDLETILKNPPTRANIYELDQLLFRVSGRWMPMCLSSHFLCIRV